MTFWLMSQTLWLLRTRLIVYENLWYFNQMNPQNVFHVGKMYSSLNNSKIYPQLTKPLDSMGWIRAAYLLCARITLETTALRGTWSEAREGPVFFQRSGYVFSNVSQAPGGFFKFMKNHDFSPRMGPNKSFMRQTLWVHRTRLILYEN